MENQGTALGRQAKRGHQAAVAGPVSTVESISPGGLQGGLGTRAGHPRRGLASQNPVPGCTLRMCEGRKPVKARTVRVPERALCGARPPRGPARVLRRCPSAALGGEAGACALPFRLASLWPQMCSSLTVGSLGSWEAPGPSSGGSWSQRGLTFHPFKPPPQKVLGRCLFIFSSPKSGGC